MRLMLSEAAAQRLAGALAVHGDRLELLRIQPDRTVIGTSGPLAGDEVRADAIWTTFDLFNGPAGRVYIGQLAAQAQPKWIHSGAAGFDEASFRAIVSAGITLTTSHGQALNMAEYVLWGVLDHFQGGPARRAAQERSAWTRLPYREIRGTNWLIVGFGAIGQAVAERAHAFGADITGIRRDQAAHPLAAIAPLDALPDLLPRADVVVMCIPLRPATRKLADAGFFAAMKSGSVLVNVGRGASIDDTALLAALDQGKPAHAILDVFENEPLPADHPFWRHPRITVTSHVSPMSDGQLARNDAGFVENLRRYMNGEALLNVASPEDVLDA